jgi:hypothetical protein
LRRRLRHLLPVRRRDHGSAGVVRGPPDGGAGGAHDRTPSPKELRTEAARAAAVVGGAGGVRRLHDLRYTLQHHESDGGRGGEPRGRG